MSMIMNRKNILSNQLGTNPRKTGNSWEHRLRIWCLICSSIILTSLVSGCDIYSLVYPYSSIVLQNDTKSTVIEFYLTDRDSSEWNLNLLEEPLVPGSDVTLDGLPKIASKALIVFEGNSRQVVSNIKLSSIEIFKIRLE